MYRFITWIAGWARLGIIYLRWRGVTLLLCAVLLGFFVWLDQHNPAARAAMSALTTEYRQLMLPPRTSVDEQSYYTKLTFFSARLHVRCYTTLPPEQFEEAFAAEFRRRQWLLAPGKRLVFQKEFFVAGLSRVEDFPGCHEYSLSMSWRDGPLPGP